MARPFGTPPIMVELPIASFQIVCQNTSSLNLSHKITQVLRGHCKLNFFLNNIGKTLDPSFSCCKGIETINHYLWVCINEEVNRINTLKKACFCKEYLTPKKIYFYSKIQFYFKHWARFCPTLVDSTCRYCITCVLLVLIQLV